ncbi:MAG TPA: hypothetical protein DCY07_06475 [Rhodospirillaceae bacterium]|nr:hypothetical protein [Rhodospirillaceae bacterium]
MTRDSQKEEELETVKRYLEVTGLSGTASINLKKNDPPDVFIDMDGLRIGVEVTRYHTKERNVSGFTRTAGEEAWKEIQDYAWEFAEKEPCLFNYDVFLRFKDSLVPNRKETEGFVKEIARKIQDNKAQIANEEMSFPCDESSPEILKKYLKEFLVCRAQCKKNWDAENFLFRRLGTSDEELCEIIKNKIPCQTKGVQENWLLIYGGSELSRMFDIPWVEKIDSFIKFNAKLKTSNYDVLALLGFRTWLRWTKKNGWEKIETE